MLEEDDEEEEEDDDEDVDEDDELSEEEEVLDDADSDLPLSPLAWLVVVFELPESRESVR